LNKSTVGGWIMWPSDINNRRNLLNKYYLDISTICSIFRMYNCVCLLTWNSTLFEFVGIHITW
jgi:hypothetical protein